MPKVTHFRLVPLLVPSSAITQETRRTLASVLIFGVRNRLPKIGLALAIGLIMLPNITFDKAKAALRKRSESNRPTSKNQDQKNN